MKATSGVHAGMRLAALLLVLFHAVAAPAQELGPEELVRKVTGEVLAAIQGDKALQAGDRRKALALAEEKILPHVDFHEAARLATNRAWGAASPEQKQRIVSEFRTMLVRIYSQSLDTYKGQTMRVQPVKLAPGETEVTMRNQYLRPGQQPVSVEYHMRKATDGWKIYDIAIDGVSLVLTYRSEFDQVTRDSGIDGLLKVLGQKNRPA